MVNNKGEHFIHKGEVVFRRIADEALLVPIKGGMGELGSIFTLNDVAASIWLLIEPSRSVLDIADAIADSYEVSREHALADVERFLQLLERRSLVERFQTTRNGECTQL